jgi:hypothetical protein
MFRLVGVAALVVGLGGCSKGCGEPVQGETEVELDVAPVPAREVTATQRGEEAAVLATLHAAVELLGSRTKAQLVTTLADKGSAAALEACAVDAPQIAAEVDADERFRVGRTALKLRNPANVAPGWVRDWLVQHGDRPAKKADALSTVVEVDGFATARVLKPLAVGGPCLNCHGAQESLAEEVKVALAARYPADEATGYKAGDLRGAIWAEAVVRYSEAGASGDAVSSEAPSGN